MAEALACARQVEGRTWPNPPVGAVVVKDGQIVGRGTHAGPGKLHAEPVALNMAGDNACGGTLYVTLEPCNHHGRTGPCAPAVAEAGIRRVVVGMRDPNPSVIGGGCRFLREHGVDVVCGVLAAECLEMVWPFVVTNGFAQTYVELKTATSLDGCFAPIARSATAAPVYLTGSESRHDVHLRRRRVDLVLVGKGTAVADHPRLDCRLVGEGDEVPVQDPQAGYVDTHLEWSGGLNRPEFLVFAGESSRGSDKIPDLESKGGTVLFCREKNGQVDPQSILEQVAARNLRSIMLEGGPTLAQSFLNAGLVDRWLNYIAPVVLGQGVRWPSGGMGVAPCHSTFHLTRTENLGRDLLAVFDRRRFPTALNQVTL